MKKKKGNIILTPFEVAGENLQYFAINMYTFYLFQKSCNELLMADTFIKKSLSVAQDEDEVERLMKQYEKNSAAWGTIMKTDTLSGSACYAEA